MAGRKYTNEQIEEMRRLLYEEQLPPKEIAARLGCSESTVQRMIDFGDPKLAGTSQPVRKEGTRHKITSVEVREMQRLRREEDLTYQKIADHYGISLQYARELVLERDPEIMRANEIARSYKKRNQDYLREMQRPPRRWSLSDEQVLGIVAVARQEGRKAAAHQYHVTEQTVSKIMLGKIYRHVTGIPKAERQRGLDAETVLRIVDLAKQTNQSEAARQFGLSAQMVNHIMNGRAYPEITGIQYKRLPSAGD